MPASVTLLKLSTKKPRVWVSGLLLCIQKTPRHCLPPLPKPTFMLLFNIFRRVKDPLSCMTRAMTIATFEEKKDIGQQMSKQGLLRNKALPRHHQAQWILFRTFNMSWTWKSMWEPWTLLRRTRRTASKQGKLETIPQDCKRMYLSQVLHVYAAAVVYYPLNSDTH